MACLSKFGDDDEPVNYVCANPIFIISEEKTRYEPGEKLVFEVLSADASQLRRLAGKIARYTTGPNCEPFYAELISLESRRSTAMGLALLRDKEALHGVFTICDEPVSDAKAS